MKPVGCRVVHDLTITSSGKANKKLADYTEMGALNEKYDFPLRFWSVNIWTDGEKNFNVLGALITQSHIHICTGTSKKVQVLIQ